MYQKEIRADLTGRACVSLLHRLRRCDFSSVATERDQSRMIPEQAVGFTGWGHKKPVSACNSSEVVITKELRVGMHWAATWGTGPDLAPLRAQGPWDADTKFIVILRDPRAVLNSRVQGWPQPDASGTKEDEATNPRPWNGRRGFPYTQSLRSLCVEHLALRAHAEAHREGGSTILVWYEELLRDPLALAERVFEFVGLDLAPEVRAHIEANIRGECEFEGRPFSLCRKLGERRVDDKWRKSLPKERLDALLAIPECQEVVDGYDARSTVEEL